MSECLDLPSAPPAQGRDWVFYAGLSPDRPRAAAAADLPGYAASGMIELWFDGVLYNRADLRRSLPAGPPDETDADLLLRGYEKWGAALPERIKGIFGLVCVDQRRPAVLAARDPIGIYPLFYAETPHGLLFSNSPESLARQPGVGSELNALALADHLRHHWPVMEETYFARVKRVPPGHTLLADRISRRVFRHWDPAPPDREVDWVKEDELEQFDFLLDQAINRCLAQGRAGIFLSGGLDSVSVAALAADNCRKLELPVPHAMSLVFPGTAEDDLNEEHVQKQVAQTLGLSQDLVGFWEAVGRESLLIPALELTRTLSAPMVNMWNPAYLDLARRGRRLGVEMILTGGGGDEWLTVSPYYAADLMRQMRLLALLRILRSMERSYRFSRADLMRSVLWTFGALPILEEIKKRNLRAVRGCVPSGWRAARRERLARRQKAALTPEWLAPDPSIRRRLVERHEPDRPLPAGAGFYLREVRSSIEHPLMAVEMEEIHETGRRVGVRIMQPFWDADLVAFLYRIPPELLNRGGRTKGLVRDMLARRFPEAGFERHRKIAATGFYRSVLSREGTAAWEMMEGTPTLAQLGLVEPRALEAAIRAHAGGQDVVRMHRIWDVLNLESWTRPRL